VNEIVTYKNSIWTLTENQNKKYNPKRNKVDFVTSRYFPRSFQVLNQRAFLMPVIVHIISSY